jgi:serine/threonine protein kinase
LFIPTGPPQERSFARVAAENPPPPVLAEACRVVYCTGGFLFRIPGAVNIRRYVFSMPDLEFQKILWQIAAGLSDIHRAGVIHRDIKLQNIRRDKFGIIKIIDFGLAREVGVDDKTKSITGTIGYMAPELFGTSTISFSPAVARRVTEFRTGTAPVLRQSNHKLGAVGPLDHFGLRSR